MRAAERAELDRPITALPDEPISIAHTNVETDDVFMGKLIQVGPKGMINIQFHLRSQMLVSHSGEK